MRIISSGRLPPGQSRRPAHEPDLGRTLRDMYKDGQEQRIHRCRPARRGQSGQYHSSDLGGRTDPDRHPAVPRSADCGIRSICRWPAWVCATRSAMRACLKIPVRANTPTLAGVWIGEGSAKPVKRAIVHDGHAVSHKAVGHIHIYRRDGDVLGSVDRADYSSGHERRYVRWRLMAI